MLDLIEEPLDQVARLVKIWAEAYRLCPNSFWWDIRPGAVLANKSSDPHASSKARAITPVMASVKEFLTRGMSYSAIGTKKARQARNQPGFRCRQSCLSTARRGTGFLIAPRHALNVPVGSSFLFTLADNDRVLRPSRIVENEEPGAKAGLDH